jgi:6-phosphofructokinase 1
VTSIAVLTSGGDSPGMNAAVRACVRVGLSLGCPMFIVERGYSGLVDGRLRSMSSRDVAGFITAGGSLIGSSRCPTMMEPGGPEQAIATLEAHGIGGLVVIGGDGTHRGARELHRRGVKVVGVPSTIDNDLPHTERTIGFDTATNTLAMVLGKLRDTAASHQRTFVVEAMGRGSGWIALHAGMAAGADAILIPEVEWSREAVLSGLLRRLDEGKTFNLLVIAEGAGDADELAKWLDRQTPDMLEVRACIPGHIQRGGTPSVSDRLFATELGARAVQALAEGRSGIALGLRGATIEEHSLEAACGEKRRIPRELYDLALQVG